VDLDRAFAEAGSIAAVRQRERGMFASLTRGARKAVIFGCGPLGKIILNGALAAGVDVLAFADNNLRLQGGTFNGLPVMSPAEAVSAFGGEAYFALGVFNNSKPRQQLRDLGCDRIVPYAAFLWQYSTSMPDPLGLDLPHRTIDAAADVRAAYELLWDDRSRHEFAAQIAWRCSLDYSVLPQPDNPSEIYYPTELMRLSDREVLVDCGAFDGESIDQFRRKTLGAYRHIFACEPDPANLSVLDRFIQRLPDEDRRRVTVWPFAIGDHDGVVHFEAAGTVSSRVTDEAGGVSVEMRRLDSVIDGIEPTIVKMDIEGAEPGALSGAFDTIRQARPILAVCAYHKNEHLWTLPAIIHAALADYRISLRRYAEECWETVYYAIPPERVIDAA
jgi:FkbM family methyltransferase